MRGLPTWIENPLPSFLWMFDEMVELKGLNDSWQQIRFAQCHFDLEPMKRTLVWCWNCEPISADLGFRMCACKRQGKNKPSYCPYLKKPHVSLTGFDGGQALTAAASQYTEKMGLALARMTRGDRAICD